MTQERKYHPLPSLPLPEAKLRELSRPAELPAQPWRYKLTPYLVITLIAIADTAGQLRAAPVSFYRRKDIEARAMRRRILWTVGHTFSSVRLEEVDAVLCGARLVPKREPIAEAIRRAAIVEDALAHYASAPGGHRLTAELAMLYKEAETTLSGRWLSFSGRERAKLLDAQRGAILVPPMVKALFEWVDSEPLVSQLAVLRAATLYWGLTLLFPSWRSAPVVIHHELRFRGVDSLGFLMLAESAEAKQKLLTTPAYHLADADDGDFTRYLERFSEALCTLLFERLVELRRTQDTEAHLPWKMLAPPDDLDARVYEIVERLGQAGSAAIVMALGSTAPPLRTVQRRLRKLVNDGVLSKCGAKKNALYTLVGSDEIG